MSHQMDVFHSPTRDDSRQTLVEDLGTDNVCGVDPVCGDSESRQNSEAWRAWGQDAARRSIETRLWARVNKNGPVPAHCPELGPCWIFTGKARLREYGSISGGWANGKRRPLYTHRVAWESAHGPAGDACVLHKCDTPLCCRPDHLFLGTRADNLEDAREKGRLDETLPRRRVLTYTDRLAIYQTRRYRGVCVDLARCYGVSKVCISLIRKGRFARPKQVFERVPSVQVPVRGVLHLEAGQ